MLNYLAIVVPRSDFIIHSARFQLFSRVWALITLVDLITPSPQECIRPFTLLTTLLLFRFLVLASAPCLLIDTCTGSFTLHNPSNPGFFYLLSPIALSVLSVMIHLMSENFQRGSIIGKHSSG